MVVGTITFCIVFLPHLQWLFFYSLRTTNFNWSLTKLRWSRWHHPWRKPKWILPLTTSFRRWVSTSKMCLVSKIGEERERTRGGGGREHSIVIERGRHRQTWLPWENRLCTHCSNGEVKEEFIFLTECNEYKNISETYFSGTEHIYSVFTKENKEGKLSLLCETMHKPNLPVSTLLPHIEKEYHITVNNKYNINMYCSFFS